VQPAQQRREREHELRQTEGSLRGDLALAVLHVTTMQYSTESIVAPFLRDEMVEVMSRATVSVMVLVKTWTPREHVNEPHRTGKSGPRLPFCTCEGTMFDEDRTTT